MQGEKSGTIDGKLLASLPHVAKPAGPALARDHAARVVQAPAARASRYLRDSLEVLDRRCSSTDGHGVMPAL